MKLIQLALTLLAPRVRNTQPRAQPSRPSVAVLEPASIPLPDDEEGGYGRSAYN